MLLWLVYALIGILLVGGALMNAGLVRIRREIPKTHVLNRLMGLNMSLTGIGLSFIFMSDSMDISRAWKFLLIFIGVILIFFALRSARATSSRLRAYLQQSLDDE
jgi:hypothetical protein